MVLAETGDANSVDTRKPAGWALFVLSACAALVLGLTFDWLGAYPEWIVLPIQAVVGAFLDWLVKDASLGLFTVSEATRGLAWLLSFPFNFVNGLLWEGFEFAAFDLPPLSWTVMMALVCGAGWVLGGRRLFAISLGVLLYLVLFGYWESAMRTLSSILLVVPISLAGGVLLGVLAYNHPSVRPPLNVFLDFCQTVPIFAYLLPVLFLFGFGPLSAMIATLIYAMPPMVRAVMLGLDTVSESVKEAGLMAGATRRQLMWQVMLPSAQSSVLLGLNQVIMLALNAVIIASLIGAGGLGYDVMRALKSLRIGQGLEAGFAIVLMAILLDKFSLAFVARRNGGRQGRAGPGWKGWLGLAAICVVLQLASLHVPAMAEYPRGFTISTAKLWDQLLDVVVMQYYDSIEGFKNVLLFYVLLPAKAFITGLPWLFVVVLLAATGWRLGGPKLAAVAGGLTLFIAVSGFWEKAMISVYLIGISVIVAIVIGLPIGIWASTSDRVSRVAGFVADTLQTLPSFVYLIPVVMLFQAGDVSALFAVIAYAVAPIIRYTDAGFRNVSHDLVEAGTAIGCTKWQILLRIKSIAALPEVLLGVNQTIMLALSMLVITALVGTRDLGQEVYIGLARTDTGRGFVAGLCVACIAIISDRLLQAYARREKAKLGL